MVGAHCAIMRPMSRQVPLDEAAQVLGVSRRTVERRVKAGTLATTFVEGRKLVILSDELLDATTDDESDVRPTGAADATVAELAALRAQLAAVTEERDFLRVTVSRLLDTQARLLEQHAPPALPAPDEVSESPTARRRWRWPWQR